jgi:pheromone a factor receptor
MAPTPTPNLAASNPRSPLAIVFPIFAALACILCIPPFVIHIRGRNFAACVLMVSSIVPNMFNFINPLIWPTEFPRDWWNGVGLCDIEVKLQLAFSVANVGSVACVSRQLAIILDTDRTTLVPSSANRLRKRIFEIGLCIGVPIYVMIAHYFVQPSRYYIYSIGGCRPSFDNSWVSFILIFVWPLILCVVATVYGGLAAYRLIKYRQQFAVILEASTSSMTKSRFIRLLALSTSLMLIYLPLSIFTFRQNVSFRRHPYSWEHVHPAHWSSLINMGAGQIDGDFDRWIQIGTAFLVFCFFGLCQDAKCLYRSWLLRMKIDRFTQTKSNSSGQTPLVAQCDASNPGSDNQQKFDKQQNSNIDISITLQEDEPVEKTFAATLSPGVTPSPPSCEGGSRAIKQKGSKPCEELRLKTRLWQAPAFKIWSDEEPEGPVTSTQSIEVKDHFELMGHVAHQQV